MSEKAIEAAAKALWDMANPDMTWEDAKADPAQAAFVQWDMECARHAIAAYEAAMWMPIEEAPRDKSEFIGRGRNFGRPDEPLHTVLAVRCGDNFVSPCGCEVYSYLLEFCPLPTVPEGE